MKTVKQHKNIFPIKHKFIVLVGLYFSLIIEKLASELKFVLYVKHTDFKVLVQNV